MTRLLIILKNKRVVQDLWQLLLHLHKINDLANVKVW